MYFVLSYVCYSALSRSLCCELVTPHNPPYPGVILVISCRRTVLLKSMRLTVALQECYNHQNPLDWGSCSNAHVTSLPTKYSLASRPRYSQGVWRVYAPIFIAARTVLAKASGVDTHRSRGGKTEHGTSHFPKRVSIRVWV